MGFKDGRIVSRLAANYTDRLKISYLLYDNINDIMILLLCI